MDNTVNCNYGKSTTRLLDVNNMLALSAAGVLIKLFLGTNYSNDGTSGPASSTIWGYGLTTISLFSLAFISLALAKECNMQDSVGKFIASAGSSNFIPIFLLLLVLIWIIALNIMYFKRINQNKVANEYHQYSMMSSVLIIFQLILLYQYFSNLLSTNLDKSGVKNIHKIVATHSASITYIFTLLNFILTGMMQIVLEFYSTDG
jgi:hypothetical protein